jgi:hypothetical protein
VFKAYLISSALALVLFSHVQYQGYSLFGTTATDAQSSASRSGTGGSGGRSSISHK